MSLQKRRKRKNVITKKCVTSCTNVGLKQLTATRRSAVRTDRDVCSIFTFGAGIIDIFCAKKLIRRALVAALQVDITIEVCMESSPFWTNFVLLNTCTES